MKRDLHLVTWLAVVIALVAATACGGAPGSNASAQPVTSKLTQEQATAIAENALQAYNAGDYAAYSRDWTDAMKAGIKESDFLSFREQLMSASGKYLSIARVELTHAQTAGFVRWVFTCNLEKGQGRFIFVFKQDGDQIEGALYEPVG